jgi:hypothetical protein
LVDVVEVVSLIDWLQVEVLASGGEQSVLFELTVFKDPVFNHLSMLQFPIYKITFITQLTVQKKIKLSKNTKRARTRPSAS